MIHHQETPGTTTQVSQHGSQEQLNLELNYFSSHTLLLTVPCITVDLDSPEVEM